MAKTAKSAEPTITRDLTPDRTTWPHCGGPRRSDYANRRTAYALAGVTRLNLTIRRCHAPGCAAHKRPYRPEAEGAVALPRHEVGLDVIALIGSLRYSVHGPGAFAKIRIPDTHERQANPRAYLPTQPQHPPVASGPFADTPSKDRPGHTDLGLWNVYLNPSFPKPQEPLTRMLRMQYPDAHDPAALLAKTVATFKTPGLRDLGHSDPYFHTGRIDDLAGAVGFYRELSALAREGRVRNAARDLGRIYLVADDVPRVVAFLRSLNEDYKWTGCLGVARDPGGTTVLSECEETVAGLLVDFDRWATDSKLIVWGKFQVDDVNGGLDKG